MKMMLAHRSSGGLTPVYGQSPSVGLDQDNLDYPQIMLWGAFTA